MVDKDCLNPVGHDMVTMERVVGNTTESWMECYRCRMTVIEIERNEEECFEHYYLCVRCGKKKNPRE